MALSPSFTRALTLAFNEWLLILMLFINSIFSYAITRFADYSQLQSPCLMCSSLDHILEKRRRTTTKHSKRSHWDTVCSKHKTEISSLVYCHAHGKLVDVRGMCEACLFSFATTNKSNAETYRLLVGKLGEESPSRGGGGSRSDPRCCTCCNQLWMMPQQTGSSTDDHQEEVVLVAKPATLPKIRVVGNLRTGKQQSNTPKKSVSFNHLPDVGYTELKVHSDTESEAVFSEDEGVKEKDDHNFQNVELKTPPPPRVITLPYDMATDKLLDLDFPLQQEIGFSSFFPEFISANNDLPAETSEKVVLKEKEIISSLDSLFFTSSTTMERSDSTAVLKEKEDLIDFQDVSLTQDALMEEKEVVPVNVVPEEASKKVLKEEEEIISLDSLFLSIRSMEPVAAVSKETEFISLRDIISTSSVAAEAEALFMGEAGRDLAHLLDFSLTLDSKESPADAASVEEEEEAEQLICLNDDVTSTSSSDASETPEDDVLNGNELTPLHATSPDEAPELFTTANETPVETSKEMDTNQDDAASLESDYAVVSPSKSASFNSMSVAADTNVGGGSGELLDLSDTYNSIPHNEGSNDGGEAHIEQWMKKDTSRVSEDLKTLLTHISASRGIELLSPRGISPKLSSSDQETKDLDLDMQLLIQKRMLERNESNLSLEEVSVSEIEGESESDRLKRQVDYDRKLLAGLYKELEEERSASAVATNQAMAMITRLQEEKALFQMEALQNLRMMEEQAEYDMEAIQRLNDLLAEKEKLVQDLEAEIEYFRDETPQQQKKKLDGAENSETVSSKIQNCLTGFNEERLYITSCLEKLERNGEAHGDNNAATQESVSELGERVEKLKGDLYFLEHVVNSLGHGDESVEFVKEIASHLQTLRSLSMKRRNDAES
ncbi:Myosin-binding protein 1 [Raphanus sativus]|uniref:Myosin-binding protein 1 n=1 Tax=Raphanus sativus TaxID=3726 RepID=A0A9W3D9Z4_RAPSA|nr:myosin-binding protein 1 [Raphanus sativus]KAJ4915071.1 Myosin-binding protein 1 [Raphanus sativus]